MASDAASQRPFTLTSEDQAVQLILRINRCEKMPGSLMADIREAVKALRLSVPIDDAAIVQACQAAAKGRGTAAPVAKGKPPVHGRNGNLVWSKDISGPSEQGGRMSHYAGRLEKRVVKSGDLLATLVAESPGTDGTDIYGKTIKAQKGKPLRVRPGAGVREEAGAFYATKDGMARLDHDKLLLDEIFTVSGDLTFDIGNINFPGSVVIGGGMLDLFEIKAGGAVQVKGLVEGASITAAGDVEAKAGIAGKKKGIVRCGGSVTAKFLVNAEVYADKDVCIEREIVTSKVMALGMVRTAQGVIAGGEVCALGGVDAQTIGSDSNARTVVVAGVNYSLEEIVTRADQVVSSTQKRLAAIRDEIASFNVKASDAKARERITELQAQRYEIEQELADAEKQRNDAVTMTHSLARPTVVVRKTIYPGVVIRLGNCKMTVSETLSGPMKFVVDVKTSSVRVVPLTV